LFESAFCAKISPSVRGRKEGRNLKYLKKMDKNFVSMENFTDFVYYDTGKNIKDIKNKK
jgi:hypothetical protein